MKQSMSFDKSSLYDEKIDDDMHIVEIEESNQSLPIVENIKSHEIEDIDVGDDNNDELQEKDNQKQSHVSDIEIEQVREMLASYKGGYYRDHTEHIFSDYLASRNGLNTTVESNTNIDNVETRFYTDVLEF